MKNILFIVGSLREGSFNKQMAETAEKVLEGKANVSYLDWKDVPVFSQDLEVPTPAPVAAVREAIQAADAIWIFSPIHNLSIPGGVKNLLDWASRALDLSDTRGPSALHDKVSTVSIVGNVGFDTTEEIYRTMLPFIRTQFVDQITTSRVNDSAWVDGTFVASEEVMADLTKQAEALLAALNEA
ncbi:NADPH-dependent FMN reductase [Streptococcus sp. 10F2]